MSMDLDPVPGLPLLTTLFCNATTVKKKTKISCDFPEELYTKKAMYGGPFGAGIGVIELALIAMFLLLSIKIKHDATKAFLTIVYIPLGLSAIFKIALAVYSIMEGAYGWWYMVLLMFFNWCYTTAVLNSGIGSVIFLSTLIVVARKRVNVNPCESWLSFFTILFLSSLLSGSYHFISSQWNQLPAAALFFTYILSTLAIVFLFLVCLCVGLMCRPKATGTSSVAVLTGDPVVDDAHNRILWGSLAVIVMCIPMWFEIYVKIVELFTPFLWESDAQKKVYYTAQAKELLFFDTIRLFLSLLIAAASFVTVSTRYAIELLITRKPHPTSQANKVFVASQNQPLLMDTGEKKSPPPPTPPNPPPPPSLPSVITQQPPMNPVPIPHQVPVPQVHGSHQGHQAPPGYGFGPGMLQLPSNMQTTIVYTPAMPGAPPN